MLADVTADRVLEFGDGFKDTASDAPSGDGGEEAFDGIEPGSGCRGEMEDLVHRLIRMVRKHGNQVVDRVRFSVNHPSVSEH